MSSALYASVSEHKAVAELTRKSINTTKIITVIKVPKSLKVICFNWMAFKRKRVYGGGNSWGSKRARTIRKFKPRFRRRGKTSSITARTLSGTNTAYRSRRIGGRRYRSMLWNSTLMRSHFRSVFDVATTLDTPIGETTANYTRVTAFPSVAPWLIGGGLQIIDFGSPAPTFSSDIIVRGGMIRCVMTNESNTDAMRVKAYLVWANNDPNLTTIPGSGTVSTMWDPSLIPDFKEFGKIITSREALLLPGSNPLEIYHRLRIQKIDQDVFVDRGGSQFYWYIQVCRLASFNLITLPRCKIVTSHNISIAGDAV